MPVLFIAIDNLTLTVIYTVKIMGKNSLNTTDKTAPCFLVCFSAVSVIFRGSVKREKKDISKKCVTKYTDT